MDNQLKEISLIKISTNENFGNLYDISIKFFNLAIKELQNVTNLKMNDINFDKLTNMLRYIPCCPLLPEFKYSKLYKKVDKDYRKIQLTKSEKFLILTARLIFISKYCNFPRMYFGKNNPLKQLIKEQYIKLDYTNSKLFFTYLVLKYMPKENKQKIFYNLNPTEEKLVNCTEYPANLITKGN